MTTKCKKEPSTVPDHDRFIRAGEGKTPGSNLLAVKQLSSKQNSLVFLPGPGKGRHQDPTSVFHKDSRIQLALGIAKVKNFHL